MIGRDSADVRDFTSDFMIAGGNGLPDLHVSALDPLMHLQDQFAARSVSTSEASATTDTGASVATHFGFPSIDEIKQGFQGFVKVTVVVVIGILLVALGAWQITKD